MTWRVRTASLNDDLRTVLRDPDGALRQAAVVISSTRGTTVGRVAGVIVKRYNRPRLLLKVIKGVLRASPAQRACRLACQMTSAGIATPRAVALSEQGLRLSRWPSYLVTEEIPGAVPLEAWGGEKHHTARRLAALLARLHDSGFSHRDLNAGNILFTPDGEPWLVDLDTARYVGVVSRARATADLARLARKIAAVPRVARTDRARFLQRYGEARGLPDWRSLWKEIHANAQAFAYRSAPRR